MFNSCLKIQKPSSASVECSNNSMNKYVWGEKLKNDKNKLNYIPVLDGHLSNDLSIIYLFIYFFTYRSHCTKKRMPFQNKQCCWFSLSWDSLLKILPFCSLLLGNTKQTLTTVEQMFLLEKIPELGSNISPTRTRHRPQRLIFWYGCYEIKAPSGFHHIFL